MQYAFAKVLKGGCCGSENQAGHFLNVRVDETSVDFFITMLGVYPLWSKIFSRQYNMFVTSKQYMFWTPFQAQPFWQEPEAILREKQEGRWVQDRGEKAEGD